MKNILIVSHSHFPSNSAIHVHHFANELVKLGLDCIVAVPHDKNSISSIKGNLYSVTQYDEIDRLKNLFTNNRPPDLVHAWTPREHVRKYCYALSVQYEFKLVIHLEDNEESVTERFLNVSLQDWSIEYDNLLPYNLSHPLRYKEFLKTADGVTVIIDRLKEFVPDSISTITLYPGVDTKEFFPQPKNTDLLESLDIKKDSTILCYIGNVHLANIDEVRSLYLGVGKRNQFGKPTVLIRTGTDNNLELLSEDLSWIKKYIIELGWIDRDKIPKLLNLADVLVQPGKPDEFNDYRFPSKIPEFLAMGKPVIIPDTNIAKVLVNEENAIILESVDENSLPEAIDYIIDNRDLKFKLSENALKFVSDRLNWASNGNDLFSFYKSIFTEEITIKTLHNALTRSQFYNQEISEDLNRSQNENIENKLKIKELEREHKLKIKELETEILAMKTSKFWKMREQWFKIKSLFKK